MTQQIKDTDSAPRQIDSARLGYVAGSVGIFGCELWRIQDEIDRARMWRRTKNGGGIAPWYQEVRAL